MFCGGGGGMHILYNCWTRSVEHRLGVSEASHGLLGQEISQTQDGKDSLCSDTVTSGDGKDSL